ncbi:MAG: hypothetical protein JWN68_511 [Nocardioides sp.]|jgi:hypothetical protein|uniref:hypothetical protein n=1 Tax=Nocardioides sp. TaxID=35761 RepID=UPI0026302AAF|nr:hypothetical protein [Nocardioides sp.]MCW2832558.1 hypothetical protein [Nocardioides sp.]
MNRHGVALTVTCLAVTLLSACEPVGGQAFLLNETGEQGLTVEVHRPDGHILEDGLVEEVYSFDTQWTNRQLQCYVATDGYLQVIRRDGTVLVRHEFADRPVCEKEEITLGADGELVWAD